MSDVFVITVPVPKGTYPSVNHLGVDGYRGGGKSPEYRELYESVLAAAKAEMIRTGWKTAEYDVQGWITRYHPHARRFDCSNLAKAEPDALEEAGVVADDALIRPIHKDAQYDPQGPDRIVIVLQRLFPRISDVRVAKSKAPKVRSSPPKLRALKSRALVNGEAISEIEARRLVMKELQRR